MRHFIFSIILMALAFALRVQAEVVPVWSTEVAVPGEQVVLYILNSVPQQDPDKRVRYVTPPKVQGATVRNAMSISCENHTKSGVEVIQVTPFYVTPDRDGKFQMGDIELIYQNGKRETVKIPPLNVRPTSDIQWYNRPYPYGVLWYCDKEDGYQHQAVKASFKLFLPEDPRMPSKWHVQYAPSFNASGVEVGAFNPTVEGSMQQIQNSYLRNATAFARGQNWQTVDYSGTFTPVQAGQHNVTGKISMVKLQGYSMSEQSEIVLPTLTISALPLPPGAPSNFANAVGQYTVSAKTSADSLAMNEAVEVEITVLGTEGLARLQCPAPETPDNWKLTQPTRKEITDLNNKTIGIVFTQLLRPTTEVSGIPAFSFGYFDPEKQEYATASSRPIPLPWRKTDDAGLGLQTMRSAEPPPAGSIPVAEMTDIYSAYMAPGGDFVQNLPRWLCYLLYLPALAILLTLAGKSIHRRIAAGAEGRALERELGTLGRAADGLAFLKGIGAFIESRIPASAITPELQGILDKRDSVAFRPDAKSETVGTAERQAMLKLVRRALAKAGQAAIVLLAGVFFLGAGASAGEEDAVQAAQADYEAAQYSACLEKLQPALSANSTNAEAWFNAGNCEYRLKHPGKAALYYARALQLKPWMREAAANLAFIQRKEGAVVPNPDNADAVFTFLSAGQVRLLTIFCTAMLALCIALQIARRTQSRPWLHTCTALTALLSLLCAVNQVYYSTREVADISALPPADLAYITTQTDARTAAAEDASAVLQLPASTPVHLLARRGSWAYVETFTGIRGWIKSSDVESLAPGSEPTMPMYIRFD